MIVAALILGQVRPPDNPEILHPSVLESRAWHVFDVVRDEAGLQQDRLSHLRGDRDSFTSRIEVRPNGNVISQRLYKQAQPLSDHLTFLAQFAITDGRMGSFSVVSNTSHPVQVMSFGEAELRAVRLHQRLFPNRTFKVYRRYDQFDGQCHVQFADIIPRSKYQGESDSEYWIDLETGLAVRGIFERPTRVRTIYNHAVSAEKFIAEVVSQTAKVKPWTAFEILDHGPRYGRLLSYGSGVRTLRPELVRDLKDGFSVLIHRVAVLDADSFEPKTGNYRNVVHFVVDSITGQIISMTDSARYSGASATPGTKAGRRPGFNIAGRWRHGNIEGVLTEIPMRVLSETKTVLLYAKAKAASFQFDPKQGLLLHHGSVYEPEERLLAHLRGSLSSL